MNNEVLRMHVLGTRRVGILTVCVVDSGAMPSLLMVNLKVYLTPASSSEPEIPRTGPLDPRLKLKVEQCSRPCRQKGFNALIM